MQATTEIRAQHDYTTIEKKSSLLSFAHILLLIALVILYALPFIFDSNLWLSHYNNYSLVLDYIRDNGFQLAPKIADKTYLNDFPFIFWALGDFTILFPNLSNATLLVSFYIGSLLFFAFSVYILGYALFFSSKVAFSASCIALTSFFALGYIPLTGYDLYFVAFVNFCLAFTFRALLHSLAPLSFFFAFIFMLCGFFTGGFFAFALQIMTGTLFLILYGNFSRLKKNDIYYYTLSFLLILALAFLVFYTVGHREYVAQLSDFKAFQVALANWEFAKNAVYYLLAILFVFLPYIFILFFINVPNFFSPLALALQRVLAKFRKKPSHKDEDKEIVEENYENELDSENSYATIKIDNPPDYSDAVKVEDSKFEVEKVLSEEEQKKRKRKSNLASLFLFSILISGIILLCVFPISTFTYVLFLSPAFSLLFAKQLMTLTEAKSKVFFSFIAWFIMFIGIATIACGTLPEWKLLYPSIFSALPESLHAIILSPSKSAFFLFGTIIIALSLIFLFSDKSNPLKSLLKLVLLFILLSWGLNFIIYSQVDFQASSTQTLEIYN